MWTSLGMLVILFVARMATDPRCLVVLNPHQHGCHTFMFAVVFGPPKSWRAGVVRLALAGFGRK